jgi:hypothetical protein
MRNFASVAPGAVWVALILALNGGAAWLSQYYGGLAWVPPVAGLLTLVLVPVIKVLATPEPPSANIMDAPPSEARSLFKRLLF